MDIRVEHGMDVPETKSKVDNRYSDERIWFDIFLAAPVVAQEPVATQIEDKSPLSNILATPAVRRMAKDLQVRTTICAIVFLY